MSDRSAPYAHDEDIDSIACKMQHAQKLNVVPPRLIFIIEIRQVIVDNIGNITYIMDDQEISEQADPGLPLDQLWTVNPACQPDEYLQCPYFPEHTFRKKRLIYHLMKCEKNPNAPKLVACPFNYTHRIKYEDRMAHVISCKDNPKKSRILDEPAPSYKNTASSFGPGHKTEWTNSKLPENETEWFP